MWKIEPKAKVKLGGNYYIDVEHLVDYRGTSLFTVKRRESDGLLGIDFDVYDPKGKKVATVRRGTIVDGDADAYEITHDAHHYTVTEKKSGRVVCDIRRREHAKDAEIEVAVDLYTPDGFHFQATPEQTNIGGAQISGCTTANCTVGIAIR
jgi:hypothetical protein